MGVLLLKRLQTSPASFSWPLSERYLVLLPDFQLLLHLPTFRVLLCHPKAQANSVGRTGPELSKQRVPKRSTQGSALALAPCDCVLGATTCLERGEPSAALSLRRSTLKARFGAVRMRLVRGSSSSTSATVKCKSSTGGVLQQLIRSITRSFTRSINSQNRS